MEYVFPVLNPYVSSYSLGVQLSSPTIPQAMTNGPIQYPQIARTLVPHSSGSSFNGSVGNYGLVSPPQASLHPPVSRRRSEYHDPSQEALALTGAGFRASIDYPDLSSQHILRPPPIAASPKERPRNHPHPISLPPPPPTIPSEYPVTYWADVQIGTMGLKNLGNTCYMNSTIQCLSATVPFARFFTGELSAFLTVWDPPRSTHPFCLL
jgi:ubiquitin carboxyl-terminal hydrolase 8